MGVKVVPISGDVSDFADAKRMVEQAIEELGCFGQQWGVPKARLS